MTRRIVMMLLALVAVAGPARAQVAVPPPPPAQDPIPAAPAASGEPADYLFPSGAGMLLFHVAPARAGDFDAVLARLKDALSRADTTQRRFQAANWQMYKSAEKPGDAVLYIFLFDPAMTTANYDPLLLLAEILPAEVQPLYERMKAAVLRIERMGLTKIR